jgi:hypothetical protein
LEKTGCPALAAVDHLHKLDPSLADMLTDFLSSTLRTD